MPALDAASQRHPGVKFIGVAVQDDLDRAADFAAEIGVSYDLAFDEDGIVIDGYPTFGMPATFLISEDGVILSRRIGELSDEQIDSFILTYFGG